MNIDKHLRCIERDLNGITASIKQVSTKRARYLNRVGGVATGKVAGVAGTAGIYGLVTTFGTASTGTPIAVLSGAAAKNATLFSIGLGKGVAFGGAILAFGGIVIGALASFFLYHRLVRKVFGVERRQDQMQEFELQALYATQQMHAAAQAALAEGGDPPLRDELRIYAREGLLPLCNLIDKHMNTSDPSEKAKNPCASFAKTLAPYRRRRLRRLNHRLSRRSIKLAKPTRKLSIQGLLRLLSQ